MKRSNMLTRMVVSSVALLSVVPALTACEDDTTNDLCAPNDEGHYMLAYFCRDNGVYGTFESGTLELCSSAVDCVIVSGGRCESDGQCELDCCSETYLEMCEMVPLLGPCG